MIRIFLEALVVAAGGHFFDLIIKTLGNEMYKIDIVTDEDGVSAIYIEENFYDLVTELSVDGLLDILDGLKGRIEVTNYYHPTLTFDASNPPMDYNKTISNSSLNEDMVWCFGG